MDRSRRQETTGARAQAAPPAASRLTVRRHKNRRRPGTAWSRLPKPAAIVDACGRAVRRSLRVVAVIAAVLALGGGVWSGYRWMMTSPRFAIAQITVQGTHRVDPDQLRRGLPVHVGDNAFADLPAIARAVRADPWIASAAVHRILPHTIAIEVQEHAAAAVVDLGEPYLSDAAGQLFKRAALDAGEAEGLPIITGIDRAAYLADPDAAARTTRDAIATAQAWRTQARPAIAEIHIDVHGAVTLHTRDQVAVQLGAPDDGLGSRLRTFDAAWAGLSDAERARARAIHLDARSDHVTVAFAKN